MDKQTQNELWRIVSDNYEQIAEQYNETRKKHLEPLWNNLIKITKDVEAGSKVLDIGCGNGRLLDAFLGRKIDYLGIDNSEKLLELSQKNHPERNFKKGDIMSLGELPELNFDYVFSVALLHHIPGKDSRVCALRQLKNKIKQDGQIVVTVWNLWSQKKYRKLIYKFALLKLIKKNKLDFGDIVFDWKNQQGESVSKRYYHAYRKRELKILAKKAGLKVKKIFKDKYNYYLILTKK